MKIKQNSNIKPIVLLLISGFISLVIGLFSNYLVQLPVLDTLIICALSFLVVLQISQLNDLRGIRNRLEGIENRLVGIITLSSLFMGAFGGMHEKLMKLPRNKSILTDDLINVFSQPLSGFFKATSEAFIELVLKPSSPVEHEEIRRLIEKANRKEISRAEAERLRSLLETERKRRENAGDNLGALVVGILILLLLGLIASLFTEEE